MTRKTTKLGDFESLEAKKLMAADLGADLVEAGEPQDKLERAFIKSWSTSGDADDRPTEEVAFYYNKIAFEYADNNDDAGNADGVVDAADFTVWRDNAAEADPEPRAIYVKIPGVPGDVKADAGSEDKADGVDYFTADSFSFGVEREMKESGEKGGTADINIGVGELQECTDSKSMDWASGPIADSFSFGVEREMKESGEKGGTEDINIGVGELQECTISKSMDTASTQLAVDAVFARRFY